MRKHLVDSESTLAHSGVVSPKRLDGYIRDCFFLIRHAHVQLQGGAESSIGLIRKIAQFLHSCGENDTNEEMK